MSESFAWKYFVKDLKQDFATCNECKAQIKCKGWSTSGLIRHLLNKHNISKISVSCKRTAEENEATITTSKRPAQKVLTSFFIHKESREEIVTKLATLDGISIHSITKSDFIRKSLAEKGYNLPRNPTHVMDIVHLHYNQIKERLVTDIDSQISVGSRFSLSLDEYTSTNNRRYLNVNLHKTEGSFWNLGMVPISASQTSETLLKIIKNKLEEFHISLEKHVVACVTDGASIMVKFGKLVECEHQLCYAHGIHLAVCDVLYQKPSTSLLVPLEETETEDEEDFNHSIDIETVLCEDDIEVAIPLELLDTGINVSELIKKVRKIAKMFRKSPIKNNILQGYVQQEHGKSLHVLLDSKTRWNSLLAMLERFLKIRSSISKALIDCSDGTDNMDLDKQEIAVLRDIVSSLEPLKVGAEKLGNRKSTLLTAEGVFSFILKELNQLNTPFSKKLKESFFRRVVERRNKNLTGLMQYLHSGERYKKVGRVTNEDEDSLPPAVTSKAILISTAKLLLCRLHELPVDSISIETDDDYSQESVVPGTSKMTLSEKLDAAIKASEERATRALASKASASDHFRKELDIFDTAGERTRNISLLLNGLKTIPPTSVESERAFSAAGLFLTKIRTRLSDRSIDHLCFLKSYYKNLQ